MFRFGVKRSRRRWYRPGPVDGLLAHGNTRDDAPPPSLNTSIQAAALLDADREAAVVLLSDVDT
jgi:hypothetical protein